MTQAQRESQAIVLVAPGLDGTPLYFRHVAEALRATGAELHLLEAPGLYGEREPLGTVEELASHQVQQWERADRCDIVCVGWSFGSMVALHMAWLLEHRHDVRFVALDPRWAMSNDEVTTETEGTMTVAFDVEAASRGARRRYRPRRVAADSLYIVSSEAPENPRRFLERFHVASSRITVVREDGTHSSILEGTAAVRIASRIRRRVS
jgi:thioesterase domain-containing protein